MKNTYNHFDNVIFRSFGADVIYNDNIREERNKIATQLFYNPVSTYPDPTPVRGRQKSRRPLRIGEYKDFRVIETKNLRHGCYFNLVYIPTGEVIAVDQVGYNIEWFVWWFYNRH